MDSETLDQTHITMVSKLEVEL